MRALRTGLAVAGVLLGAVATAHAQPLPTPRIIGGSDAIAGAFPYVALVEIDAPGFGASCSGSLVAPNVVLTAGHCAFDESGQQLQPADYEIAVGFNDLMQAMNAVVSVSQVIPYPYFNSSTLQGDAALLVLSSAAPAPAAAIPLASSANGSLYAAGQPATIVGWGVTSNAPGAEIPETLQTGTVAVQSNAVCNGAQSGSYHPGFDLCADAPGFMPSTCFGDSGGPLVVATATGPVEIGVDSYGLGQSCGGSPDYFTRASSIQPWVANVLAGLPAPPVFVPAFVAPAPTAALAADGVTVSFAAPVADSATIPTGYVATLLNAAGAPVSAQSLPVTATSATFPSLQPGTYSVGVAATYSEGSSAMATSTAVTLKPPANRTKPTVKGHAVVGSTLTCRKGTWSWPGAFAFGVAWLRNGRAIGRTAATYKLVAADAGKRLACRVTLKASTGPAATAASPAVVVALKLRFKRPPRISGTPALGRALTCLAGSWIHSGRLKLSYRWLRAGKPISGGPAAKARRTVGSADLGRKLACRVTAAAAGQSAAKATRAIAVPAA